MELASKRATSTDKKMYWQVDLLPVLAYSWSWHVKYTTGVESFVLNIVSDQDHWHIVWYDDKAEQGATWALRIVS